MNEVLGSLSGEFSGLYSHTGRPSIPPEKLLRALLLQAFYSIRSERQLMEQLNFNLLFRWFVGLGVDDAVWDATVFCKNRDRLLAADVSAQLLAGVVAHPKVRRLLSQDHFSVDGTLFEAWASMKSFRPKGGGGAGGAAIASGTFTVRGARTRATKAPAIRMPGSTARAEARKAGCASSTRARSDGEPQRSGGRRRADPGPWRRRASDRDRALVERHAGGWRVTVSGDKAYDTSDYVMELRELGATPHVTQNAYDTGTAKRRSAIDGRTTRHPSYAVSQQVRKRIEERG